MCVCVCVCVCVCNVYTHTHTHTILTTSKQTPECIALCLKPILLSRSPSTVPR